MKNIRVFLSEKLQFLEVKFSIYLNRCVFVMVYILLLYIIPINSIHHFDATSCTCFKIINKELTIGKYLPTLCMT